MSSPQMYGRYELMERIAVGGMGEIWRAKLTGLEGFEKTVAIKKILPHLSDDPQFIERLVTEAKIAVALSHAHVVEVYELGRVEGEYYIAMEFVDGPDLATLLQRAERSDLLLPLPLAVHVGACVSKALDYAHRKKDDKGEPMNIVHRDVSPQNILLSIEGAIKLSDFGIARAAGLARQFHTDMGVVLGKRKYMAPEQRRGERVDSRADVFAAGAVVYEMITGTPPDEEAPVAPSELVEGVPPELDEAVMAALAPEATARPTAGLLGQTLDRLYPKIRVDGEPPPPDPTVALGACVVDLFPAEERQAQRPSLTSFVNAAMQGRDIEPLNEAEHTGPVTGSVEIDDADSAASGPIAEDDTTTNPTVESPGDADTRSGEFETLVGDDTRMVRRPPGETTQPPDTAVVVAAARANWRQQDLRDGRQQPAADLRAEPTKPPVSSAPATSEKEKPTRPTQHQDADSSTQPSAMLGAAEPSTDGSDTARSAQLGAIEAPTAPSRMAAGQSPGSVPDTTRAPRPGGGIDIFPVGGARGRGTGVRAPIPETRSPDGMGFVPAPIVQAFRYLLDSPDARWLRILLAGSLAILALLIGIGLASLWT